MKHSDFYRKNIAIAILLTSTAAHADDIAEQQVQTVYAASHSRSTRTEHQDSYTASAMKTTTGLALTPKETPQSVSVITKTQLENQGISRMEDALKNTTGVNVVRDSGRYRYLSRGFYINQIEEDGIATTVAAGASGNPYRDAQSMTDMAVYDHVEVVRGATGLTQANGEPGGTINAVRKRPTAQTKASASLSADRFGTVRGTGDISGSLNASQSIRGRVVSVLEKNNSFKHDVGENVGLLYGVAEADVGDNTKITAGTLFQRRKGTTDYFGIPMGVNGTEAGLSRDTYLGYDWNKATYDKFNIFAELEHYLNNDWKLTGRINHIINRSDSRLGAIYNTSTAYTGLVRGNTLNTQHFQHYENDGKQSALQLNLNGKYNLFGRRHDAFAGYTYSREKTDTVWQRIRNSTAYDPFIFQGNESAEPDWSNYSDQTFYHSKIASQALMLGTRFHATDRLHILAGARYTRWKASSLTDNDWWNGRADADADVISNNSRNRWIPYLGITYDLTPKQSVYASYTSIFKPQTNLDRNGKTLDPLMGNNYELGWKGEWANRRLNTSVALFHVEQKNRPIYVSDSTHRNGGYYTSLGKAVSRGVDMEISGDLTKNWKMFAGYTINNSRYRTTESARYTGGSNFSTFTPRHLFRLYTVYTLPFDQQKWQIGTGLQVQSKASSIYSVSQSGYALWNANIQYRPTKQLQLNLVGTNLTDKRYYENHRVRMLGVNNFYGEPRNVMLQVNYQFK